MSSQPVSLAKTTRPALGSVVRREALFVRLDGQPGRTLAWISGPPGAGKSTLAASYVDARGYQCAWYQLDPDDADVATFFHYLGHAARKLGDGEPPDLPAFTAQHLQNVAAFSRRFFRQLFSRARANAVLVLDNLHEAAANTPLQEVLRAGLAQVPKHCCVIVTSRGEPLAALARMQVSGEMTRVGGDDLRIGPHELAQIASLRGLSLPPEAVATLQERTQGWAAGLVLMLEHAKISGRITEFPGDATPKLMFDYFAGEIFDRFEAATQQFLLRIACLPRMTVAVAEALSGEKNAGRLLLNLAHNEYFVRETVTDDTRVYQLHPLLREFLRNRAIHALPAAMGAAELQRAAALLRSAGHNEDAVSLLIECRDWSEVARLAAEQADAMLAQGRSETLAGWLELLPRQLLDADPRLLHILAVSRVHASPRAARRLFEQAYAGLRDSGDSRATVQSCCGIIGAIILEFDDLAALDRWMEALASLLGAGVAAAPDTFDPGATETLIRAMLLRDPGNLNLEKWLDRAERAARAQADTAATSDVLAELALARAMATMLQGDLDGAASAISALRVAAAGRSAGMRIACSIAAAFNHVLGAAYADALHAARDGLANAAAEGLHTYDEWLRILAAAAALGAGDCDTARSELQALDTAGARLRRGDRAFIHFLRSWLAVLDGDIAGANREAKSALDVAVEAGIPWLECLARVACAQAMLSAGDQRGAESQARGAEILAAKLRSPLLEVSAQLVATAAAIESRDDSAALAVLADAFAQARERGFRHLPGIRPPLLADLCALALRHAIETAFVRGLIAAGNLAPPRAALHLQQWPRPFHISTLGGFELMRESMPVEFSKKGPGRPVELLKVLIALGGRNVRTDQLADALWPRVDADYAHKSFTATLHRLRRILEADDALMLADTRLSLNPALFWVDAWSLDHLITELDGALREPQPPSAPDDLRARVAGVMTLYRGPFLPDEAEQPSFIAYREQLRAKLARCVARIARRWEDAGMREAAVDCYLQCVDADALCEAFYRGLMQCHQRHGDCVEALSTYERLRTLLATRLNTAPSPETQAVYAALLAPQANAPRA